MSPSLYSRHFRATDIETLAMFDELVARGAKKMSGWHLQGIDLRERGAELRALDPSGALFLGCALHSADEESIRARGGLVFPRIPDVPFNMYRADLYSPRELYAGLNETGYEASFDAQVYAWSRRQDTKGDLRVTLAAALHDHAISDALDDELRSGAFRGRNIAGVMGGHSLARGSEGYAKAANFGRILADAGLLVATGGGPGAMEAANCGAFFSADPGRLDAALATLAEVPSFVPDVSAWAKRAYAALDGVEGRPSLGIPTWFYGHEPPNLFATHIAKYFTNAVREAVLLEICNAGIAFLPGSAGTVQEIFQDACENHYASPESVAPMVLIDRDYWTRVLPAWPLLHAVTREGAAADMVFLVDTEDEAAEILTTHAGGQRAKDNRSTTLAHH